MKIEQYKKGPVYPLRIAIHSDMDYAWTVWCNFIMPIIDAGAERDEAENAVTRIFCIFFDYDVVPMRKKVECNCFEEVTTK